MIARIKEIYFNLAGPSVRFEKLGRDNVYRLNQHLRQECTQLGGRLELRNRVKRFDALMRAWGTFNSVRTANFGPANQA